MPRPLRPIDDGLVYHVINRGNNHQDVFRKEEDFQAFLRALLALKARKPFELYGYCLMRNHFHLLLRPIESTISRGNLQRWPSGCGRESVPPAAARNVMTRKAVLPAPPIAMLR
jgi:REP element-mobilizing transposase RayT